MNELKSSEILEAMPLDGERKLSPVSTDVNTYLEEIRSKYNRGLITTLPEQSLPLLEAPWLELHKHSSDIG